MELYIVLACGLAALVYGVLTVRSVLSKSAGTARMQEISAAIQEGAIYYLIRILTDLRQPGQANDLYRFMATHYPRSPYLRLCQAMVTGERN